MTLQEVNTRRSLDSSQDIGKLLEDSNHTAKAAEISRIIESENGVKEAHEAIEKKLSKVFA
jgi:UDP:flavonoid glycosyltransferase YjiC (YdhE family)